MSTKQKRKAKRTNSRKKKTAKLPVKVVQSVPKKPKKEAPKQKTTEVRIFERHEFGTKIAEPEVIIDEVVETEGAKAPETLAGQEDNSFLTGEIQETVVEKLEDPKPEEVITTEKVPNETVNKRKNWGVVRVIASIILVIAVLLLGFALGRMIGQIFWKYNSAEAQSVQMTEVVKKEIHTTRLSGIKTQTIEAAKTVKTESAVTLPEKYRGKKLVALTFDDGPSETTTKRLLGVLKEKSAKATFFVVGTMAQKSPELVKQELAAGHEVGSHTLSHVNLSTIGAVAVKAEMAQMNEIYTKITGEKLEILRPPYGAISATVRANAGMPMVVWTVDTLDWKNRDAEAVRQAAVKAAFDGSVILMHDIYATTVDAVAGIIDDLRAQGYEFLTVSELAAARETSLEAGNVYGSFR